MAKRKRDSSPSVEQRDASSPSADEHDKYRPIAIAENPYQVKILPTSAASKASGPKGNWTAAHAQKAAVPGGAECAYKIYPADKWQEMKKYTKFVVSDKSFGIGDYIYIFHGEDQQDPGRGRGADASNWVAQVLEIRALDPTHVYIRVFWMYWPDELPEGREDHHGAYELVASNHMEIMDAMTVTDTADVLRLEDGGVLPSVDLYWRQTLDVLTRKVTGAKKICYCNNYQNPEKLLIQCPHCEKYLHEGCLQRDACSRAWFQEKTKTSGPDQQLQHDLSATPQRKTVIPDSQKSNGTTSASQPSQPSQPSPPPPPPPPPPLPLATNHKPPSSASAGRGRGRGRPRKHRARLAELQRTDPWEPQMKAHIEMNMVDGEETAEASGMATVCYDPIDRASDNIRIGLRCLMPKCGKWLFEESGGEKG